MFLTQFFSRRWRWATLLIIMAMGVTIRLGFWQLDRLEQRRAYNTHVLNGQTLPPLDLTAETILQPLETMEYRTVTVTGEYDVDQQIALRNQAWYGKPGYDLLTPLRITGTDMVVLVNRGWVPATEYTPDGDQTYPTEGVVTLTGVIRLSQSTPDFGRRSDPTPAPGQTLAIWNFINVDAIATQLPYPILPVYIQRGPDASLPADFDQWTDENLPYPRLPTIEITEGPHMGYAIQWFTFAAIFGIGYPIFISRRSKEQA